MVRFVCLRLNIKKGLGWQSYYLFVVIITTWLLATSRESLTTYFRAAWYRKGVDKIQK